MKTFLTVLAITVAFYVLSLALLSAIQSFGDVSRELLELAPDASLATDYLLAGKITLCMLFITFFSWFFSWIQSLKG